MINLTQLNSTELARILQLRQQMELCETEMATILAHAKKRAIPLAVDARNLRQLRKTQPSLRDLISGILKSANTPMSVPEIYEASLKTGYQWHSQEPINALNVKIYTDKTFKKTSPGRFVLRKKGSQPPGAPGPAPATPT